MLPPTTQPPDLLPESYRLVTETTTEFLITMTRVFDYIPATARIFRGVAVVYSGIGDSDATRRADQHQQGWPNNRQYQHDDLATTRGRDGMATLDQYWDLGCRRCRSRRKHGSQWPSLHFLWRHHHKSGQR